MAPRRVAIRPIYETHHRSHQLVYRSDTIEITEGYEFSQYETLRTIELYDNDRFLTGNKDSLDREKPFFNIVSFRKNVAIRATDLDKEPWHDCIVILDDRRGPRSRPPE